MAQSVEKIEVAQPEAATSVIQIIERAASDPNVDVEKWERLIAMHERMEDRAAEKAFNQAKTAAQSEMPAIVRDADNDQTRSKYARLETISDAIDPVITRHGFSTTFSEGVTNRDGHIRVLCDLAHEDGHSKQYHLDVPLDDAGLKGNRNKTPTHATGSTFSYGRRYLKCMVFDVKLKGEDVDGNQPIEYLSPDQIDELIDLAESLGIDREAFCKAHKVSSFDQIAAEHFDAAKRAMHEKAGK